MEYYCLPNLHSSISEMANVNYFTSCDLDAAFLQISVEKSSRDYTSFSSPFGGRYRFKRMPFGVRNGPSLFQRLADIVFKDLKHKICTIYLDDIIIYSVTPKEMCERLEQVFVALQNANLKLKPEKTFLMRNSITFLGHELNFYGIKPSDRHLECIKNYPVPKTLKEIRAFVGLCGFFRRHIANFSKLARPLTECTKKEIGYTWGTRQQDAFDTLKTHLVTAPLLRYPDLDLPFTVISDASGFSVGAVLCQDHGSGLQPVAYTSKLLNQCEMKYSVSERETLAIIWALKAFKIYLYMGPKFTVMVDHLPLKFMTDMKNATNSRCARWLLFLSNYNFEIVYTPGRNNISDPLSRIPPQEGQNDDPIVDIMLVENHDYSMHVPREDDYQPSNINGIYYNTAIYTNIENQTKTVEILISEIHDLNIPIYTRVWDRNEIKINQSKDKTLKQYFEIATNLDFDDNDTKNYVIDDDGILYKARNNFERNDKIMAPELMIPDILKSFHDMPYAGHLSFQKTYQQIKVKFYWNKMRQHIKAYCRACHSCAINKKNRTKKKAPMGKYPEITTVWGRVHMDLTGPIYTDNPTKYKYIATFQDYFTKYVICVPVIDARAITVAKSFVNNVILIHGVPQAIISDNGAAYTAQLMHEICRLLKIKKLNCTPYHPEGNSSIERYHSSLKTMLRHYITSENSDWVEMVKYVTFAYNCAFHSTTKESPYFLQHGRDPIVPYTAILTPTRAKFDIDINYGSQLAQRLHKAFKTVKDNLENARRKREIYFNKKTKEIKYEIGEKVYLEIPPQNLGVSRKLQPLYRGPYRIINKTGPVNVTISEIYGPQKNMVVHVNRIKACYDLPIFLSQLLKPTNKSVKVLQNDENELNIPDGSNDFNKEIDQDENILESTSDDGELDPDIGPFRDMDDLIEAISISSDTEKSGDYSASQVANIENSSINSILSKQNVSNSANSEEMLSKLTHVIHSPHVQSDISDSVEEFEVISHHAPSGSNEDHNDGSLTTHGYATRSRGPVHDYPHVLRRAI